MRDTICDLKATRKHFARAYHVHHVDRVNSARPIVRPKRRGRSSIVRQRGRRSPPRTAPCTGRRSVRGRLVLQGRHPKLDPPARSASRAPCLSSISGYRDWTTGEGDAGRERCVRSFFLDRVRVPCSFQVCRLPSVAMASRGRAPSAGVVELVVEHVAAAPLAVWQSCPCKLGSTTERQILLSLAAINLGFSRAVPLRGVQNPVWRNLGTHGTA